MKPAKPKKTGRRLYRVAPCPKCGDNLRIIDYTNNELDICMKCEQNQPFVIRKYLCVFCDTKLTAAEEKTHDSNCIDQNKFYSRADNPSFDRCTDLQYQTMIYMHKKC